MSGKRATYEAIVDSGVTAILRGIPEDDIVSVARAVYNGGVRAIEITADAKRCSRLIAAVDEELGGTDAIVGAGTVMDTAAARNVIEAGAEFVLAPNLNENVVDVCNREGIIAVPGVMTPTEAVAAMEAGADVLKLFPASSLGPEHVSALRGPLGDVPIMPTGGVSSDNVAGYFEAGAIAVGAGSALIDYDAVEAGDPDRIEASAAEFVRAVDRARR